MIDASMITGLSLIEHLQSVTTVAVTVLICIGAISTAFGFAWLGGKFMEAGARQPEVIPQLQVRLFILAGLLDAVPMIGVGIALYFVFLNPYTADLIKLVTSH